MQMPLLGSTSWPMVTIDRFQPTRPLKNSALLQCCLVILDLIYRCNKLLALCEHCQEDRWRRQRLHLDQRGWGQLDFDILWELWGGRQTDFHVGNFLLVSIEKYPLPVQFCELSLLWWCRIFRYILYNYTYVLRYDVGSDCPYYNDGYTTTTLDLQVPLNFNSTDLI